MDHRVGKRSICNQDDVKKAVSVGRDRRRGHQSGRGRGMRGRRTHVQMKNRQAAAGRTRMYASDPYRKYGFLPLL